MKTQKQGALREPSQAAKGKGDGRRNGPERTRKSLGEYFMTGRITKVTHLTTLEEITRTDSQREVRDHLYSCLAILDTKAPTMLTFNSIIIAVFALFLTQSPDPNLAPALVMLQRWTEFAGMFFILISTFFLLLVGRIYWASSEELADLGQLMHEQSDKSVEETAKVAASSVYFRHLLMIRDIRSREYRIAWLLSMIALIGLLGVLLIRIAGA